MRAVARMAFLFLLDRAKFLTYYIGVYIIIAFERQVRRWSWKELFTRRFFLRRALVFPAQSGWRRKRAARAAHGKRTPARSADVWKTTRRLLCLRFGGRNRSCRRRLPSLAKKRESRYGRGRTKRIRRCFGRLPVRRWRCSLAASRFPTPSVSRSSARGPRALMGSASRKRLRWI